MQKYTPVLVFILALFLGGLVVSKLPFGYTESALIYLAAVIAATGCWIGRER